ncbi:MAG: ribosome maturation factor RimP [Burkholderiales bacterium]|nr:ribosome maturation factor RimP [Burkholderiales bacterium]
MNGRTAHFLFVALHAKLESLLETTLSGMGYEMVALEMTRPGGLVRVYIDRASGIDVDDCAVVSNHLSRLFAVEGIDYDRLEVSSPGLDRPLRKPADFRRFVGERAQVKTRIPIGGRKNFTGKLCAATDSRISIDVDGTVIDLDLSIIDKARLVPNL